MLQLPGTPNQVFRSGVLTIVAAAGLAMFPARADAQMPRIGIIDVYGTHKTTPQQIRDALGISITTLLDYEQGPKVRVVPADQVVRLWHTDAGSYSRLLAGAEAPGPLEMWDWRLMPGESSGSDPHPVGTVEIAHVTAGELTLTVEGTEYRVPAGASVTFEADAAHPYGNQGEIPTEMVLTVSVPPVH